MELKFKLTKLEKRNRQSMKREPRIWSRLRIDSLGGAKRKAQVSDSPNSQPSIHHFQNSSHKASQSLSKNVSQTKYHIQRHINNLTRQYLPH